MVHELQGIHSLLKYKNVKLSVYLISIGHEKKVIINIGLYIPTVQTTVTKKQATTFPGVSKHTRFILLQPLSRSNLNEHGKEHWLFEGFPADQWNLSLTL